MENKTTENAENAANGDKMKEMKDLLARIQSSSGSSLGKYQEELSKNAKEKEDYEAQTSAAINAQRENMEKLEEIQEKRKSLEKEKLEKNFQTTEQLMASVMAAAAEVSAAMSATLSVSEPKNTEKEPAETKEDVSVNPEYASPQQQETVSSESVKKMSAPALEKNIEQKRMDQDVVFPKAILDDMISVVFLYGKDHLDALPDTCREYSWSGMNAASAYLEKCIHSSLGKPEVFISCVDAAKGLCEKIKNESSGWGSRGHGWSQWAGRTKAAIDASLSWIPKSGIKPLVVPEGFPEHKLSKDLKSKDAPAQLIENLQQSLTFYDYASQEKDFTWTGTSHGAKLQEFIAETEGFSAETPAAVKWKDNALDAYAKLNARFILLQSPSQQDPNLTAKDTFKS